MTETKADWFYIVGGERLGPVAFSDLKALYEDGELSERTLVWTKDFADDWKRISEVTDIREDNEPPLVPTTEIPNRWLYMLVAVPLVMSLVEAGTTEAGLEGFSAADLPGLAFMLFFLANTIFALLDQNAVERSGRKDAVNGLLGWILFLVPVYIYLRSKRTGLGVVPLLGWLGALIVGSFLTTSFPGMVYLGSGLPTCESRTTNKMIMDLYPQIPLNFTRAEVVNIHKVAEINYSEALGQRQCTAVVQNTSGRGTPVVVTISEQDGQVFYEVRFGSL